MSWLVEGGCDGVWCCGVGGEVEREKEEIWKSDRKESVVWVVEVDW